MSDITNAKNLLHGGYFNPVLRFLQSSNCVLSSYNLMYPLFLADDANAIEAVQSMPGVNRYGVNQVVNAVEPLVKKGLSAVLLFGVIQNLEKDANGTNADSLENPVVQAISKIKTAFPQLLIACDVCLCPYTSHGHCGILNADGSIDNKESIKRLACVALTYAKKGAHVVSPSCMMDGIVLKIKQLLIESGLENKVSVLSYSIKFASCFYGPFRDAAKSAPSFGNRRAYQLPIGSAGLAKRAAARDVEEGTDMLMVKPGLPYLDVLKQTKDLFPEFPLFVYQVGNSLSKASEANASVVDLIILLTEEEYSSDKVSGEYSMLVLASQAGTLDLKTAVLEILSSFRRAGADCIISYFTPLILDWMEQSKNNSSQKSIVLSL